MEGKVVSTKMNKTVVVEVERWVTHPIYKKRLKRTARFSARNDISVNLGDKVEILETKPVSKTVFFKVNKVLEKSKEGQNDSK